MSDELESLFQTTQDDSQGAETPTAEAEETATTESTEDKGDTDEGATPAPEEESADKPGKDDEETQEPNWAKVAYLDEKRKRQQYEDELRQLREQMQQQQNPKEKREFLDDPEAALSEYEARAEQRALARVVSLSRDMMMESKPDYEEKEQLFVELARKDPTLAQKMQQSPNPAKFAYDSAVQHQTLQEMKDPEAYKEKLKEQIRKEVEEEYQASKQGKGKAPSDTPDVPSLADARAVAGNDTDSVENKTLEDVFGR